MTLDDAQALKHPSADVVAQNIQKFDATAVNTPCQ